MKKTRKGTQLKLTNPKNASEVNNVLNYILKNGIKHKRTRFVIDPYNSAIVLHYFRLVALNLNGADIKHGTEYRILKNVLGAFTFFNRGLRFV